MIRLPLRRVTLAAGVALLVAPTAAFAGTASISSDGVPRYDAASGEINNVKVGELPGSTRRVRFSDTVPVHPTGGCQADGVFAATCEMPSGLTFVRVRLQDGDDRLAPDTAIPPATISYTTQGDGGDDVMIGTAGNDAMDGSAGDDVVRGGGGNDNLEGGSGNDTVIGDAGHDDLFGDGGSDTLNADDGAGGDTLNCGATFLDNDLAIFNWGDVVSTNCNRQVQH
jgi:hypothetical protein